MYRAQPATHTDPSVSLYYFLSEPDCPPRIPGRGELRAVCWRLQALPLSLVIQQQLSAVSSPGQPWETAGGAEPIMRQVTQETRAMLTERQNKIWSLTF